MQFSDIHIHALCDCDDGAKSLEQMYKMIDAAYVDGTRYICLTPHYNPGYFGENTENVNKSFELLLEYAKKYPDLQIILGNELRYNPVPPVTKTALLLSSISFIYLLALF